MHFLLIAAGILVINFLLKSGTNSLIAKDRKIGKRVIILQDGRGLEHQEKSCPSCGAPNDKDKSLYCKYCGRTLLKDDAPEDIRIKVNTEPRGQRKARRLNREYKELYKYNKDETPLTFVSESQRKFNFFIVPAIVFGIGILKVGILIGFISALIIALITFKGLKNTNEGWIKSEHIKNDHNTVVYKCWVIEWDVYSQRRGKRSVQYLLCKFAYLKDERVIVDTVKLRINSLLLTTVTDDITVRMYESEYGERFVNLRIKFPKCSMKYRLFYTEADFEQ